MKSLNLEISVNPTSLGNVSYNFLRELFRRRDEIECKIIPAANQMAFNSFDLDSSSEFASWVRDAVSSSLKKFNRCDPSFRNWHINGSQHSTSKKPHLYTYYETDSPTEEEINIVINQQHTFFSSSFAAEAFRKKGLSNVSHVPLGFDEDILKVVESTPDLTDPDVINFGLIGKFEFRKNTVRIIQNWIRKYGDNLDYNLNCLVSNQFLSEEHLNGALSEALFNRRWRNVNILPFFDKSADVYRFMKHIDIDLSGLSGGEGWNLPAFNNTCIGNWSIVSNCSAHKDWATSENCILVEPDPKISLEANDGIFFHKGAQFNQGNFFYISDEAMIEGMERSEAFAKKRNTSGEKLRDSFTYKNSMDAILQQIYK